MTDDTYADDSYDPVTNRSEIVFCYDAVDANPNGNPLSGANRPRIDPETQQAIVTDVRLKRYLRDQLDDDGHGVYVRNVKNDAGKQSSREDLLADRMRELDPDDWDLGDLDDDEAAELREEVFGTFLDASADVRYFGATMSVDMKGNYEGFEDYLPDHFTGPVQFSPAKTLHPVTENEEYNSLTSVIATGEGKEQGGFDLDDHRIQYGFIAFHGLVDENGAADTKLSEADVERLDTLPWRAIKNQTISRSKVGQSHDSTSVSSTRTRASTSVGSLAISISTKSTRHLSTNFGTFGISCSTGPISSPGWAATPTVSPAFVSSPATCST